MSKADELPIGWATTTLSDICSKITDGSHNPPKKSDVGLPMLSAINISNNQINFDQFRLIDPVEFERENKRTQVSTGDVLVTIVGSIGRAAVVSDTVKKFTLQRSVAVLKPISINSHFVMHQIEAANAQAYLRSNAKGTAQKGIYLRTLSALPLSIPPLNEQRRIVEKIETLFQRLDKGEEAVRQVQTLLARYRQSVLKAAVTGQLTADWRAERAGSLEPGEALLTRILQTRRELASGPIKPPVTPKVEGMPELPSNWVWASIDSLAFEGPTNGTSPKPSNGNEGVRSFKLTATTSGQFIISDDTIKLVNVEVEPDSKYWLRSGDVLIQRGNTIEYVGTAAIFPGPDNCFIYPDLMMRLRFVDATIARWATKWINCEYTKRYFRRNATGTAGNMPKINGTVLRSLAVPLPPRSEIERCLALMEEAEARQSPAAALCETELKRSASLRQSILRQAYAGRLVPQDPTDEPASTLLARIKAKTAATAPKRGRKPMTPGKRK